MAIKQKLHIFLAVVCTIGFVSFPQLATAALPPTWQTSPNPLPATNDQFGAVVVNHRIYVIGGTQLVGSPPSEAGISSVYYASINPDGSTGAWTLSPNALPISRQRHTVIYANGYLYVAGGNASGSAQTTVFYAPVNQTDGSVGAWQSTTYLPVGLRRHSAAVYNSHMILFGGSNAAKNTVYSALLNPGDGTVGAWMLDPQPMPAARYFQASVSNNGYVYLFGGRDDTTPAYNSVWYSKLNSDGSTGTWQISPKNLPVALSDAAAFVSNNTVFLLGGSTDGSNTGAQNKLYYAAINADGSLGDWQTHPVALPVSVHLHSVVTDGDYGYLIGGADQTGTLQAGVYYASLADLRYQHIADVPSGIVVRDVATNNVVNAGQTGAPAKPGTQVRLETTAGVPVALVGVDLSQDRDWSGVTMATDSAVRKSVVFGLPEAAGVVGTHSLYVPKAPADDSVIICPGVSTLAQVTPKCANATTYTRSSTNVSIVTVLGQEYWLVSGLSGTGGMSTGSLVDTSQYVYIYTLFSSILIGVAIGVRVGGRPAPPKKPRLASLPPRH